MDGKPIQVKINGSLTTATVETSPEGLTLSGRLGVFIISWEDLHRVLSAPEVLDELEFAEAVNFSPAPLRNR